MTWKESLLEFIDSPNKIKKYKYNIYTKEPNILHSYTDNFILCVFYNNCYYVNVVKYSVTTSKHRNFLIKILNEKNKALQRMSF
jgi:hypothetical protein